jgi:hypothetical protein
MTKAALCTHCSDIVAPYRDWRINRAWRWCECDHMGVRWVDGARGLFEVTAMHGEEHVRVIGINNGFLENAVRMDLTEPEWRELHTASTEAIASNYLFHKDKRACWALIVRVGESGDVAFAPYAVAKGWVVEDAGHAVRPA